MRAAWLLLGFMLWALPVSAQRQYDVVMQGVPLEEALVRLMSSTDLILGFDQRLIDGKWTSCVIYQSTGEEVLQCVLKGTGLDYFRLPSGLFVLSEKAESRAKYGVLQGVVIDVDSGDPLEHAHVMLHPGMGTTSNQDGRFIFSNLNPGVYAITTTYVGYESPLVYVRVIPDSIAQAELHMRQESVVLRTPIIVDGSSWQLPSDTLGQQTLGKSHLYDAGGAMLPDASRALSTLVGVRTSDATADLHIQNSGTGEHQYRLDNAPVFVPISIGGLVGPFSTYALERVTVHKTGFSADIGSQTAGVIAATHTLGSGLGHHLDVHLDPMSVNARASHRLKDGSAIMVAGRVGLWDFYAPPSVNQMLQRWNETDQFMYSAFRAVPTPGLDNGAYFDQTHAALDPGLHFSDAHFAVRKRNSVLSSSHASVYWGRRQINSQENPGSGEAINLSSLSKGIPPDVQDRYVWNNLTGQVRHETVLGSRAMLSVQARASLFRMQHDITTGPESFFSAASEYDHLVTVDPRDDNGNRIQEYGLASRLTYALWKGWNVEAGFEPAFTHSRFVVNGTRSDTIVHYSRSWRIESFLQNRIPVSRRLTIDAGTRVTFLQSRNSWYAEPRIAARYDVDHSAIGPWSLRLATGLYRQYLMQFDVSSRSARALRSSSRMWMAVDESVAPPTAAHLSVESVFQFAPGWSLQVEGYYKRLLHQLSINYAASSQSSFLEGGTITVGNSDLTDSPSFISTNSTAPSQSQSSFLSSGSGHALGISFYLERKLKRLQTTLGYEFSHAERSFGNQFDGRTIVAPWNEPHRLELSADLRPLDDLVLQARWQSVWGRAWGFWQSYYDFLGAYGRELRGLAESPHIPNDLIDHDILSLPLVVENMEAYRLEFPEEHKLPPLHQLDLSVAYTHTIRTIRVQARAEAINVLNFQNTADWGLVSDPEETEQPSEEDGMELLSINERYMLPIMPSMALRLVW